MVPEGKVIDMADRRPETQEQMLERLFDQYEPALRAFIRVRLSCREDREDIVQDVFYRLARIEGLANKLNTHQSPRAYLLAMANNLLIDHLRKRSVRISHESQCDPLPEMATDVTPETLLAADRELEWVKRVLRRMTPKCRTAFVLKRFQHMSGRDIAHTMGISESRVNKYIARAMQALRDGAAQRQ